MLPFKKGAFVIAKTAKVSDDCFTLYFYQLIQVPIVPCVFSSYKPFYNFEERRFEPGEVVIRILPKVSSEGKTVDELSDECRKIMADAFIDVNKSLAGVKKTN